MTTNPGQSGEMEDNPTPDRDTGGDGTASEELPLDKVFEILKNSRRRQTLAYLNENSGNATLSDLAEHIAAIENDVSVRALSSDQRKRVYVGLYQCHLPKMDDMRIIRFDKHRGTVELTALATQFDPYIGDSKTVGWSRVNFGVSAAGIGLVALSTLGILPLGISYTSVAFAVLVIVAVSSAIQVCAENDQSIILEKVQE